MFVLKFIILLVILVALLFNGLLLASNKTLSGGEKSIGIALYLILVILIGNFVISYITYFHTKDKIGPPGDPGIEGQKGDQGKKAICKPNCGRKICYVDVKTFAEKVLNNEIQKIRGTVQIGYEFNPDSVNTKSKIARMIREKLQNKFTESDIPKDEFGVISQDYVKVTKSGGQVKARISGSKSLGTKLYKEFLASPNNKDTSFLNLDINGEVFTPNLIIEDIRALSNCLNEDEDEKEAKSNPDDPNNTMVIEVCGEETTSSTATTSASTETNTEEIKKFMSGMDRDFKIRNEFMVKKINKICNSNEYLEALERKHKNKINEIQLIEYIKNILEEMIIYLINFKVKKVDTDGNDLVEGKIIYAGLNFLLTRSATENYFELYKEKNGEGNLIQIKSPILELKKYDIYRWGEKYINSPLIIERCNDKFKLPKGKEQELNLTATNSYVQMYNSKVKSDIFYEGYSSNCKTYCPYNQMGVNGENPENKKLCIYYNINDRGHRNLKGEHISWVRFQYMVPPPLGLYHPKINEAVDKDGAPITAYFQDDKGIIYYPVGSVWTARIDGSRSNRNDFSPVSNNKSSGHSGVGPEKETILLSGNLLPPVDYKKIWNSKEGCQDCQEGESSTIWEPIAPKGYVSMGHIISRHDSKDILFNNPPVFCVPESCVIKIPIGPKIWDSDRLLTKDMGINTFTSADRFVLHLNCYLKEKNERSKNQILQKHTEFVNSELIRLNNLAKDTKFRYCKVDQRLMIEELSALKEKDYIKHWDQLNIAKLYNHVNKVNDEALAIEEKYAERYVKCKDMLMKDIRKLNDSITPDVTASAPVYIFSAGATGAFEESMNMPGMKIDDDAGHNLFLACTDLKKAPKFAYKLNRACLYSKKIKPIKLNAVPGVLNFNQTDRISSGKSAEQYFTYPKDLVIESVSSDYSPTEEPKRYYLSFSNKPVNIERQKFPMYFIRAPNVKTNEYSLCKIATPNGRKIVEDEMNVRNERALFVLENSNGTVLDFNSSTVDMPIRLRNVGFENGRPYYFHQSYFINGRNVEKLSIDNTFNFILKRI